MALRLVKSDLEEMVKYKICKPYVEDKRDFEMAKHSHDRLKKEKMTLHYTITSINKQHDGMTTKYMHYYDYHTFNHNYDTNNHEISIRLHTC